MCNSQGHFHSPVILPELHLTPSIVVRNQPTIYCKFWLISHNSRQSEVKQSAPLYYIPESGRRLLHALLEARLDGDVGVGARLALVVDGHGRVGALQREKKRQFWREIQISRFRDLLHR